MPWPSPLFSGGLGPDVMLPAVSSVLRMCRSDVSVHHSDGLRRRVVGPITWLIRQFIACLGQHNYSCCIQPCLSMTIDQPSIWIGRRLAGLGAGSLSLQHCLFCSALPTVSCNHCIRTLGASGPRPWRVLARGKGCGTGMTDQYPRPCLWAEEARREDFKTVILSQCSCFFKKDEDDNPEP